MGGRQVTPEWFWSNVDRRGPDECWPWRSRAEAAETQLQALQEHAMPNGLKCVDLGECFSQHQQLDDVEAALQALQDRVRRLSDYVQHRRECALNVDPPWSEPVFNSRGIIGGVRALSGAEREAIKAAQVCTCGLASLTQPGAAGQEEA